MSPMFTLGPRFRIKRDYILPLTRRIHQSTCNRIPTNIFPLFREMLFVSNAGIEKILLKTDSAAAIVMKYTAPETSTENGPR